MTSQLVQKLDCQVLNEDICLRKNSQSRNFKTYIYKLQLCHRKPCREKKMLVCREKKARLQPPLYVDYEGDVLRTLHL